MAALGDGTPLTAAGTVAGGQTGTYVLPLLGSFVVESVVAEIDNSGGPDIKPTVLLLDKSGAVIATKRQSSTIPAGDTGRATWALRLADEGAGAGITEIESLSGTILVTNPFGPVVDLATNLPATSLREFVFGTAVMPASGGFAALSWAHSSGAALLGYANPLNPTVLASGVYAWSLAVQSGAGLALAGAFQAEFAIDLGHADEEHWFQTSPNTSAIVGNPGFLITARVSIGVTRVLAGNRQMNMLAAHGGGVAGISADMFGVIQRLR